MQLDLALTYPPNNKGIRKTRHLIVTDGESNTVILHTDLADGTKVEAEFITLNKDDKKLFTLEVTSANILCNVDPSIEESINHRVGRYPTAVEGY